MNTLMHCQLFLCKKRIAIKPHIHKHTQTHTHIQRTTFSSILDLVNEWLCKLWNPVPISSPSSQVCLDIKWDHIAWNNNLLTKKDVY